MDLDKLLSDVDLSKLNDIFQMVLKRQMDKIDPVRSKFGKIEMEEVSLPDKMDFVTDAPVSYTHLDVYKRQLQHMKGNLKSILHFQDKAFHLQLGT